MRWREGVGRGRTDVDPCGLAHGVGTESLVRTIIDYASKALKRQPPYPAREQGAALERKREATYNRIDRVRIGEGSCSG